MVPKVYHAHIPKTAGTSLNAWLDDSVSADRAKPDGFDGELVRWFKAYGVPGIRSEKTIFASCWDIYDVLHGHNNMSNARTDNSIVVTVMRDPLARSISLYYDLASLSEDKLKHMKGPVLSYRQDCLKMSFNDIRNKWSHSILFQRQYLDYMCRFFMRNDFSFETPFKMSSEERFRSAAAIIERDVTAYGVTEQLGKTVHRFSQVLGLYPRKSLPRYNLGRPKTSEITSDDKLFISTLTVGDRMLWEHYTNKLGDMSVDYSVENFESAKLGEAIKAVRLMEHREGVAYGINAAFIGDGFWGRDSARGAECRRWSGPEDDSVLYLPWTQAAPVDVALHVSGWSSPDARSSFSVRGWSAPLKHSFSSGGEVADIVRFRAIPRNGVLKLQFHSLARTDEEVGNPVSDGRRKAFSLKSIVLHSS